MVVALRVQKERFAAGNLLHDYQHRWQINKDSLSAASDDVILMHPGPVNWDIEISSELRDDHRSYILQQAANAVFARMSILNFTLS